MAVTSGGPTEGDVGPALAAQAPRIDDSTHSAATPGARGALTLIINPIATTVSIGAVERIRRALAEGFDVTVRRTEAPGHATDLAQDAVLSGADAVAVYAGDGTTNEAIRALAGTQTALAHLPGGSASVLARMLGMGSDGVKAAHKVGALGRSTRSIDLGYVDGRPFSFTCGVGLDGAVVKLVDQDLERKRRFRWVAFWTEAVRLARTEYFGADAMITIESGGASARAVTAIVQNAEFYSYAGALPLTIGEGASLTSGTLAASALLEGVSYRDIPTITGRTMISRRTANHPRIHALPATTGEVVVRCDRPMPMQVDGDYWKDITEARFTVRPAALRVIA